MTSPEKRKADLDIAKGVGIILVVLGHCPQIYNPLKQWIYAFHMPLFFFISGMVWNRESHEKRGYFNKSFVLDKLKRLIVPCLIWGVLYILLDVVKNHSFSPIRFAYLIYGSQSGFSHAGSLTSLWFLPCMFLSVCAFELIQMTIGRNNNRVSLLLVSFAFAVVGFFLPRISSGYPWCVDVMFLAVAFMLWGYLGTKWIENIDKILALLIVAVAALVLLTSTYKLNLRLISINNVDMAGRYFGNPMLYLVDAAAGIIAVILISRLLEKGKIFFQSLGILGKRTLPVFVIHKPVVQLMGKILPASMIPDMISVLISAVIAIGISITVYNYAMLLAPFVFGEKKRS